MNRSKYSMKFLIVITVINSALKKLMNIKNMRFFIVIAVIVALVILVYLRSYIASQILSIEDAVSTQLESPSIYKQLVSISTKNSSLNVIENGRGILLGRNKLDASSIIEAKKILHRVLVDSVTYPDLIVGILGLAISNRRDTIADFQYWSSRFTPIDTAKMIAVALPIPDFGYVRRISPSKAKVHSILMTNAREVDENLYLLHLKIQFTDTTYEAQLSDAYTFHAALLAYYPARTFPTLLTNFLVLLVLLLILWTAYREHWMVSKRFHQYFLRGVSVMVCVFACFSLPGVFQFYGGTFPEGRSIANIARLLPDNAFFLYAGLSLLGVERKTKLGLISLLVVFHLITYMPLMWLTIPILLKNESMFFIANKLLRELPPQLYAFISCTVIGIGVYRRGKIYLKPASEIPSEMYQWLTVTLSSVFVLYGLLQPLHTIIPQETFFTLALLAKVIAFSGIVFFSNMEVVLVRFRGQQLVADTLINASPEPMIVFDDNGNIQQISKRVLEQLKIENVQTRNIEDVLADKVECDFLDKLISNRQEKYDFLLKVKDIEGHKLLQLASYVRIEGSFQHLITLRPLDKAALDEFARSIRSHSTKGDITAAIKYLNQLVKAIKEDSTFPAIEHDPRLIGLREILLSMIDRLEVKENPYKRRTHESHSVKLDRVIEKIRVLEKQEEFFNVEVKYVLPLHSNIIHVRHDEEILIDDMKELLINANKKFINGERGVVTITCIDLPDDDRVKIVVQDTGNLIDEDVLVQLNSPPLSILQPGKRGLTSIQSNMKVFGGDLKAENLENKTPTFTLILWKTKEI